MRLLFWNVQRLGSDAARRELVEDVFRRYLTPDLSLFCELMLTSQTPKPTNLTFRKKNAQQLCYGAEDRKGDAMEVEAYVPVVTGEYRQAGFKGGGQFRNLVDRQIAYLGPHDGVELYLFHAPGGAGKKSVAFAACDLDKRYGDQQRWMLVGDLNVEPEVLAAVQVGIDLGDLIRPPDAPTYHGPKADKKYDYALSNFSAKVHCVRRSPRSLPSDHSPIWVTWE